MSNPTRQLTFVSGPDGIDPEILLQDVVGANFPPTVSQGLLDRILVPVEHDHHRLYLNGSRLHPFSRGDFAGLALFATRFEESARRNPNNLEVQDLAERFQDCLDLQTDIDREPRELQDEDREFRLENIEKSHLENAREYEGVPETVHLGLSDLGEVFELRPIVQQQAPPQIAESRSFSDEAEGGIPMDFHQFTTSRSEARLALDIKEYIGYLETHWPGSLELEKFLEELEKVLMNEMKNFDFVPTNELYLEVEPSSFKHWLVACGPYEGFLKDRPKRERTEIYRAAIQEYQGYLGSYSELDLAAFGTAREKWIEDDRRQLKGQQRREEPDESVLTPTSTESATASNVKIAPVANQTYFEDTLENGGDFVLDDFDIGSFLGTPVDGVPSRYGGVSNDYCEDLFNEDVDNNDDYDRENEEWEANKPQVPFSSYVKSIWHSPITLDAYEALTADLNHYQKHYLTPRGTPSEQEAFTDLSTRLLLNAASQGFGWVPPSGQGLQSLGDIFNSKLQSEDQSSTWKEKAEDAISEYTFYLLLHTNPDTLASFQKARAEWALLDRKEFDGLPRMHYDLESEKELDY
jgi:hypothetical protein